jgi:hypothetical protein
LGHRADAWGSEIGQRAAALAPYVTPTRDALPEPLPVLETEEHDVALEASVPGVRSGRSASARGKKRPSNKVNGIFISRGTVLRLANGAAMPRGALVPAVGGRPAGLRLSGVSALGIGMRDGDVLTQVLGASVASAGDVIQRVIAARARHARDISGEFWRDGVRWSLVVEQPYVDEPAPPAAP